MVKTNLILLLVVSCFFSCFSMERSDSRNALVNPSNLHKSPKYDSLVELSQKGPEIQRSSSDNVFIGLRDQTLPRTRSLNSLDTVSHVSTQILHRKGSKSLPLESKDQTTKEMLVQSLSSTSNQDPHASPTPSLVQQLLNPENHKWVFALGGGIGALIQILLSVKYGMPCNDNPDAMPFGDGK